MDTKHQWARKDVEGKPRRLTYEIKDEHELSPAHMAKPL